MSHATHKADAPGSIRCFVLTISDTRTEATDASGRAIADLLTASGHLLIGRAIVQDDAALVRGTIANALALPRDQGLRRSSRPRGTGITSRDSDIRSDQRADREAPRRIRRAVPDAQLSGYSRRRDDEPRVAGLVDGRMAELASYGIELDGTRTAKDESMTLVAAVPPGRSYCVPFTLDATVRSAGRTPSWPWWIRCAGCGLSGSATMSASRGCGQTK